MAREANQQTFTEPAVADLSAKQYYAVARASGAAGVDVAVAAKNMDGILQNKPTSGQAASVARSGNSKAAITSGSAVLVGSLLEVDTGGTLKLLAAGFPVAKALEANGSLAAVALIEVAILPSNSLFV